jgi:hypothetical protein
MKLLLMSWDSPKDGMDITLVSSPGKTKSEASPFLFEICDRTSTFSTPIGLPLPKRCTIL